MNCKREAENEKQYEVAEKYVHSNKINDGIQGKKIRRNNKKQLKKAHYPKTMRFYIYSTEKCYLITIFLVVSSLFLDTLTK